MATKADLQALLDEIVSIVSDGNSSPEDTVEEIRDLLLEDDDDGD